MAASHAMRGGRLAALAIAALVAVSACGGGASPSPSAVPSAPPAVTPAPTATPAPATPAATTLAPATLELWLGGILTTATPGSDSRKWVDQQIERFKQAFPGSDVNITLLPANNDQLAAQVQAAFAANNVPDLIMLYSGSYTLAYKSGFMPLNKYIDATPGFYDSMSLWELSCDNYDCQNGQGVIYAVPSDAYSFLLYYNTALFAKAGITKPPTTYDELYQDCDKLNAQGIIPFAYGDRDGYTTVNLLVDNIASYWEPGDVQKFVAGELKFTDPKWVDALEPILALRTHDCVNKDASTLEQLTSADLFTSEKAAIFQGQPQFLPYFKPIYDKVVVTKDPRSGNGPLNSGVIGSSGDDWAIPAAAKHPDLAWELIKLFSDETAGSQMSDLLGSPPCNLAAQATIDDSHVQAAFDLIKTATVPEMDIVMSQATALFLYKHLQLAFAGQETAQEAMQAVQQFVDQNGGKP